LNPARELTLAPAPEEAAYRVAPHNTEAEQALLGAILVNNATYHRVSDFLRPEHFYNPVHQRIFAAVRSLAERGEIADPARLKSFFEHDEALEEIGGASYLGRVAASVVTIINASDYARTIFDLAARREMIEIGTELVNDAYDLSIDDAPADLITATEAKLYQLAEANQAERSTVHQAAAATRQIEQIELAMKTKGQSSITTGFPDIDKRIGGLQPHDLVIIAGRPSMGKTAFAYEVAIQVAKTEVTNEDGELLKAAVGFFSQEMSAEQLAGRGLAYFSGISTDRQRMPHLAPPDGLTVKDVSALMDAQRELNKLPIYIDDNPVLTPARLRQKARRMVRKHGVRLIIVDYLQLMDDDVTARGASGNRVQDVSNITRGLKKLAKELNIPVIALSQLSRAVEQREDKRPMLSDLRESGSIEQDADVVMFLYREEYYLGRAEPAQRSDESDSEFMGRAADWSQMMAKCKGKTDAIIAKSRFGRIGKAELAFDGARQKFTSVAHQQYDEGYGG
jgi:replicative DNA helicase